MKEKGERKPKGAALLAMKSDLEQIALGAGGEVRACVRACACLLCFSIPRRSLAPSFIPSFCSTGERECRANLVLGQIRCCLRGDE